MANTEARFLERVRELTGIGDDDAARRAARAVISVLFEQLSARDRSWLAGRLPLKTELQQPALSRAAGSLPDFYERVASREGVERGFALEHTQTVCRAIGERLDDDARLHLTKRLPAALADLFATPEQTSAPPRAVHDRARSRTTLSEGHAGSLHPLSASAPHAAQAESVANSDNPHADTKLSSSPGSTQERERETLAEYDPDAPRKRGE